MNEDEAAQAMLHWAVNAPPGDLGSELMAAFGPDGWGGDELDPRNLVDWLFRGHGMVPGSYVKTLHRPMREAMQLLEHAELVYVCNMSDTGLLGVAWSATRLGLAALVSGKAAVRQRITHRTGL
jgi:hypothetical protein